MAPAQHTLNILTGLPGSGKSTHAVRLVEQTGALHLAMDDEVSARGLSLVDYEARFALQPQVEARIPELLGEGSVVAEFGSWAAEERSRLRDLGRSAGARVELHWVDAPIAVCAQRVLARGGPGSEELAHTVVEGMAHLYEVPGEEEIATYGAFHHIRT